MLPILRIFGFSLQTPLLALIVLYALALWMVSRMATRAGIDGGIISDAGFYAVLIGVAGARVGYVLLNLEPYLREPLSALMPSATALNPIAGIVSGAGFGYVYIKRRNVLRPALLDALAYGMPFLLIGVALASYFSGDSFGTATQLPWSVYLWGAWRHPVQLYECVALIVIFVSMYLTRKSAWPDGARLTLFVVLYGITRVFVDGFRADATTLIGMRVTQLAGIVISATAIWLLGELLGSGLLARVDLTASNANSSVDSDSAAL